MLDIDPVFFLIILFAGSFAITYLIMPKIIGVVHYKDLMNNPIERSSHSEDTPSLGGVAFYIVLILGMFFLSKWHDNQELNSLYPGLLILFIIGLKDDLVVLGPITKLIAQIAAISFVLIDADFYITHLNGFLGLDHISLYWSIPMAAFLMLMIINAYNLIDGIDGLASIVGIIVFLVLGTIFFLLHMYLFAGISAILIGALSAFLRFNLSSTDKIFMGDTGSLIIGFVIAVLILRLFAAGPQELKYLPFQLENLPIIIVAMFIVPFFDTARVFTIRLINRKDPFAADRNHIHHILIDQLKLTHVQASVVIGLVNILFVLIFMFLGTNFDNLVLLGIMILAVLVFVYFFYRINFSYKNLRRFSFRAFFNKTSNEAKTNNIEGK